LGQVPQILKAAKYKPAESSPTIASTGTTKRAAKKDLVGVDVFIDWTKGSANELGDALKNLGDDGVKLTMISNRGVKVWPGGHAETFCSDHWRCRFLSSSNHNTISHRQIISLLGRFDAAGYDSIKTENLYNFDGDRGYSLDQGE
jgi:isocitrate dehydrogenase